MPFDATGAPSRDAPAPAPLDAEARARAYAARLDVLLTELDARTVYLPRDEAIEEALHAIGNLLGGLGCKGFAHDLEMHLARVEADLLGEADPWDYGSLGGNDPDAIFSARLSDEIDVAREDDCCQWLSDAQEIMSGLALKKAAIADLRIETESRA